MAGETIKSRAICLDIRPWSQTSHIVTWLTPDGVVSTVVKGAVRPKSAFLGQYDLNYTCDLVYYARTKGELHALRECVPRDLREGLRGDFRALTLAGYCRKLVADLAPAGAECAAWYEFLGRTLDTLTPTVSSLLVFELGVLELAGLRPDFSAYDRSREWSLFSVESGSFANPVGRCLKVSREVADYLCDPERPHENLQTPLDAARVIGVFYQFHMDIPADIRRNVLALISENTRKVN